MDSGKDEEIIKKSLFKSAMEGDWKEVVNLYQKHSQVHKAKITRSGDTALHVAISDGQEDIVEQLVELFNSNVDALKVKNERGNTPLHFAASLGNTRMCDCIASKDPKLIGARNNESETPFFLAALHGNKHAFLRLHSICGSIDQGYLYCRRYDGETVLHSDQLKLSEHGENPTHPENCCTCISCKNPMYPENYNTCLGLFDQRPPSL